MGDWRCCQCGKDNHEETIHCSACKKQRWSQLGLTQIEAIGLSDTINHPREARK